MPARVTSGRLFRRLRGLSAQLLTFTILPLVALLVLVAWQSTFIHQRTMRTLIADHNEGSARVAAAALSAALERRVFALRALADRAGDGVPLPTLLAQSTYLAADFDGGLAFFSPAGELLGATNTPTNWMRRPITSTLAAALVQDEPVFSFIPVDLALGGPAWLLAVPARDGTISVAGVFSARSLGAADLARRLGTGEQATIFILDADGYSLFQIGPDRLDPTGLAHAGVQAALRGESGRSYTSDTDGYEHVVAYSSIQPTGWALLIEEPWADEVDPRLRTSLLTPLALIPAVILAVGGLWFGAQRVVRPLQQLEAAAAQVAWGNFGAIEAPVGGIAEIVELQATLRRMAQQIRTYQAGLRDYSAAMTRGQEEERRRLARALHDDTVQALIALDQRVQAVQRALAAGTGPAPEKLAEVRALVGETIASLRRFIQALRPIYLEDLGLIPALEMLARSASRDNLAISFNLTGQARRLSPEQELTLYRIVQEALSNVARHSGASQAGVNLEFSDTGVMVRVEDNGQGFTAPERVNDLASRGHFGLMGMQERAELIGAQLTIHSQPDRGTVVVILTPPT